MKRSDAFHFAPFEQNVVAVVEDFAVTKQNMNKSTFFTFEVVTAKSFFFLFLNFTTSLVLSAHVCRIFAPPKHHVVNQTVWSWILWILV